MDSALKSALSAPIVKIFTAFRFEFGGNVYCVLEGEGSVTFGGETYSAKPSGFGAIKAVEYPNESANDESPVMTIVVMPNSVSDAISMSGSNAQGTPVKAYLGAVNPVTNAVIGVPELLFNGVIESSTTEYGEYGSETCNVTFDITSALELFFADDDGVRLNGTHHRSVWPSELGLDYISEIGIPIEWGKNTGITQPLLGVDRTSRLLEAALPNLRRGDSAL